MLEPVKAACAIARSAHSRGYVLRGWPRQLCVEPERRQRQHLVRPRCREVAGASVFCSRLVQRMIPPAGSSLRSCRSIRRLHSGARVGHWATLLFLRLADHALSRIYSDGRRFTQFRPFNPADLVRVRSTFCKRTPTNLTWAMSAGRNRSRLELWDSLERLKMILASKPAPAMSLK